MMRFLKRLWMRSGGSDTTNELSKVISRHETMGRFIFSREHFAESKGLVKPRAFLPDPAGETSVFRITDLRDEAVWHIGNTIRSEPAKARGDIIASAIEGVGLRIEPAPVDHPRHAVILNWPEDKHQRLMRATLLSKATKLHLPMDVAQQ